MPPSRRPERSNWSKPVSNSASQSSGNRGPRPTQPRAGLGQNRVPISAASQGSQSRAVAQIPQRPIAGRGGRGTVLQGSRFPAGSSRQGFHSKQEEIDTEERQVLTSGVQNLHVHDYSFASHELLLNSDGFQNLRSGDLVQLFQPSNPERRFTLTVRWLSDVRSQTSSSTRLQVSILKGVAEAFGLSKYSDVTVHGPVEPDAPETEASFIEIHFKDQFISRGDLWRFNEATINLPAYRGKVYSLAGIRAKVEELKNISNRTIESGVITKRTKVIFRSRSSRIFWLVQMSLEMWQPFDSSSGELYFERFIDGFVRPVLQRWREDDTSHSLSVVFFTRTQVHDTNDVSGLGSSVFCDAEGRYVQFTCRP
jgi:hypothetical protein